MELTKYMLYADLRRWLFNNLYLRLYTSIYFEFEGCSHVPCGYLEGELDADAYLRLINDLITFTYNDENFISA